jgi:hypothetical protein
MLNYLSAHPLSVKDADAATFSNHFSSDSENELNLKVPKARAIQSRATQAEKNQLIVDINGLLGVIRTQLVRCTRPKTG